MKGVAKFVASHPNKTTQQLRFHLPQKKKKKGARQGGYQIPEDTGVNLDF